MMNQALEMHATVICLQESKILLVRKEAPEWLLPGGKIDPGETQLEAASRELQEETCLQLTGAQFLGHHILTIEEHWLYRMTVSQSAAPSPSHESVGAGRPESAKTQLLEAGAATLKSKPPIEAIDA